MGLAAGVVGAAAIGGAASLGSGLLQSGASSSAAKQQAQSQQQNLQLQMQLLGVNEQNQEPFVNSGHQATQTLDALLTPGSNQMSTLESLPGFQFQSKWGTKSAQNALSAQGLGGSTGPLAQAISNYNNGLASTYYSNYVSQLQNQQGAGISAANGVTGATGQASVGGGNALTGIGNANAAGTLGSANALSNSLGSVGGSASNALLLSSLLGGSSNSAASGGIFGNVSNNLFDGA